MSRGQPIVYNSNGITDSTCMHGGISALVAVFARRGDCKGMVQALLRLGDCIHHWRPVY